MSIAGVLPMFAHAIGAVRRLLRIDAENRRVVPVSAQTKRVAPTVVYNLTLDRDNAYYANDVLVFNCQTFAEPVMPSSSRAKPRFTSQYDPFREVNKVASAVGSDYDPFR